MHPDGERHGSFIYSLQVQFKTRVAKRLKLMPKSHAHRFAEVTYILNANKRK